MKKIISNIIRLQICIILLSLNLAAESYQLKELTPSRTLSFETKAKEIKLGAVKLNTATKEVLKSIPTNIAIFTNGERLANFITSDSEEVHSFSVLEENYLKYDTKSLKLILESKNLEEGSYLFFAYSKDETIDYPFIYLGFNKLIEEKEFYPVLAAFIVTKSELGLEVESKEVVNFLSAENDSKGKLFKKLSKSFDTYTNSIYSDLFYAKAELASTSNFAKLIELISSIDPKTEALKEFRRAVFKTGKLLAEIDVAKKEQIEELRDELFRAYHLLVKLNLEEQKVATKKKKKNRKKKKKKKKKEACSYPAPKIKFPNSMEETSNVRIKVKQVDRSLMHEVRVFKLNPKQKIWRKRFPGRVRAKLKNLSNGVYRIIARAYDKEGNKGCYARKNFIVNVENDSTKEDSIKDECLEDPNKLSAGICGCGVAETDTDGDSIPNCNDNCPTDASKSAPGICGCGVADIDSDGDGILNCLDNCPSDSFKSEPLTCGCGTPETDTDSDGTLDCQDLCPTDPLKTEPLTCGCGTPDVDTDSDGTLDCQDLCPTDPLKTEALVCGCGVPETDTDSDGTPDCNDQCPNDPNKRELGECGCGVEDTQNEIGEYVCRDVCPEDPNKLEPGVCGCGNEELDGNKDGITDCGAEQTADVASNRSVYGGYPVYMAEVGIAQNMEQSLGAMASVLDMKADNHELASGTKFNFLLDINCIGENGIKEFFSQFISEAKREELENLVGDNFAYEVISATLPEAITVGELKAKVKEDSCIQGISDTFEANALGIITENLNDPSYPMQDHLKDINFEDAYQYFNNEASDRIILATIDTGYDMQQPDGTAFSEMLVGSNIVEQFEPLGEDISFPQDTLGHGTLVGSIIAAGQNNTERTVGIAAKQIRLLPIRLMRNGSIQNGGRRLFNAIRYAVNSGAKIVNVSLGGLSEYFCDPVIGEAIYLAIEKGVFFVFSAGNGYPDRNGVFVPIELKGPTDDGPQNFGKTLSPACWGEYFKGAITVGALETGEDNLAIFSNYGHPVEMLAPGTGITGNGLLGSVTSSSGTSFSAPQVAAAAALIMSIAKTNNWYISPWLLEDMLINGSPVYEELKEFTNEGKYLDLKKLKEYAEELQGMNAEERRRIPSKNQRVDDGWDPEKDLENVEKIIIGQDGNNIKVGVEQQLNAFVLYKDGSIEDITQESKVFWTAEFQNQGITEINPKTGLFKLKSELPDAKKSVRIIVHYGDYEGEAKLNVINLDNLTIKSIEIKEKEVSYNPDSNNDIVMIDWGDNTRLIVLATYEDQSNNEFVVDVTRDASFTSDYPNELELSNLIPGFVSTKNAYGDKNYIVSASFEGQNANLSVLVKKRDNLKLVIRNALGNPFRGQYVRLRSVIESENEIIDLPSFANWSTTSEYFTLPTGKTSDVLISTENLPIGSYTVKAEFLYRGNGTEETLMAEHTFQVEDSYDRLSLLTKTPIINYQSRAVFSLRFFSSNNSYTVIDPANITWSTNDSALIIDNQGIVYPTSDSLDDGKAKNYTVHADYLENRISASIRIVPVSAGSGQKAVISHIVATGAAGIDHICNYECTKAELSAAHNRGRISVLAYYTDGSIRNVTAFASLLSSDPQKLKVAQSGLFGVVSLRPTSQGNEDFYVAAFYEGHQARYPIRSIPITKIEFSHFRTSDGDKSLGDTFNAYNNIPVSGVTGIITYTDALNRTKDYSNMDVTFFENLGEYTCSNQDNIVNQDGNFVHDRMTIGQIYPVECHYKSNTFGTEAETVGNINVVLNEVNPMELIIRLNREEIYLEEGFSIQSFVKYTENRTSGIPIEKLNISLSYEGSDEEVIGVGHINPLESNVSNNQTFYVFDESNFGKTIVLNFSHIDYSDLTQSVKVKIRPRVSFEYNLAKETIPTFNLNLKQKDSYCTSEKQLARPYAGGNGYPEDPYLICSAEQLMEIPYNPNNEDGPFFRRYNFKLLNNIDFSNYGTMEKLGRVYDLDGNGYAISNYSILDNEMSWQGLFRGIEKVRNLTIINPTVRGARFVGALTGGTINTVENVVVKGGTIWGKQSVGGLYGGTSATSIKINKVLIDGTNINFEYGIVGGLAGSFKGQVTNSRFNGRLNSVGVPGGTPAGYDYIGGLVGRFERNFDSRNPLAYGDTLTQYMFNSFFDGEINTGYLGDSRISHLGGSDTGIGGLVGQSDVPIIESSSNAYITSSTSNVGGLVGTLSLCNRYTLMCPIIKSEFTGQIVAGQNSDGASNAGGLVGQISQSAAILDSHVKANAIIRGKTHIGGLIGNVYRGRILVRDSTVAGSEVTSSVENNAYGGFIGSLDHYNEYYANLNEPDERTVFDSIFNNNQWQLQTPGTANDIGLWKRSQEILRNFDVNGIEQIN